MRKECLWDKQLVHGFRVSHLLCQMTENKNIRTCYHTTVDPMYASVEMIKDSVNSFVQHATVDMTKLEWAITKNLSSQTTVDVVMKSTSYPPHPNRHSQKTYYSQCSKNLQNFTTVDIMVKLTPWVKTSTNCFHESRDL